MIWTMDKYVGEPIVDYWADYCKITEDVRRFTGHGWQYNAILSLGEFKPDDIVADIGGGRSYLIPYLCNTIKLGYVIDKGIEDEVCTFRDWYSSYFTLPNFYNGKVVVLKREAEELPFKDNYLDKVITVSAFEHFVDVPDAQPDSDIKANLEVYRTLKSGGVFIGAVDFNSITRYPNGDKLTTKYTLQSFMERIVDTAEWQLCGGINVSETVFPPDNKDLFFKLRKE